MDEINEDVISWMKELPRSLDLVVGIPRSGMIPANLISLYIQVPVLSLDSYLEGINVTPGKRIREEEPLVYEKSNLEVLVLDDTVHTGSEMRRAKDLISNRGCDSHNVKYGAVYVKPGSESFVDCYFEKLSTPRVFEWNIMHHVFLSSACVDIDGVLCREPTEEENDDGPAYQKFLQTAEPLFIPDVPIQCLVTNRLEKYRRPTKDWLSQHGVQYERLIMEDLPSKEARQEANRYAAHKADAYVETEARLFVESSPDQASGIARLAGKPVYCVETSEMVYPNTVGKLRHARRKYTDRLLHILRQFRYEPGTALEKVANRLLPEI